MNSVPWSAESEKWMRSCMRIDQISVFIFLGLTILGVLKGSLFLVCLGLCSFAWICADLWYVTRRYEAMLQNKPRSTVEMTKWIRLETWQTEIICVCGANVHMQRASWYPNSVDPGGGRFSIVCSCGVGYYKLKNL